ncbi:MAG: hypothetical protein H0Z33_00325 [Bacillaceae bacterium]|nr:hypothetical protein [Bacillaceae bacterium]
MSKLLSFSKWILFAVYLYFTYHLLVTPLILDLSYLGIILVSGSLLLLIGTIPRRYRRQVLVFGILFLLMDKSFYNMDKAEWSVWLLVLGAIPVILLVAGIGKWYGKLPATALVALIVAALLTIPLMPRNEVPLLSHFMKKWTSEPLYTGKMFDYFPLAVQDVNGDGKDEIITLGNVDETEPLAEGEQEDKDYRLPTEPIYLYVLAWNGKAMERLDEDSYDPNEIGNRLPKDDPGFPYYVWSDNALRPTISRQELAEGMLQFGTAPFRAMALNIENISEQLKQSGGVLDAADQLEHGNGFHDIRIENGNVSGYIHDHYFELPTTATTIVDGIRLPEGKEGLLLLGNDLEILTHDSEGNPVISHRLTRQMLKNVAASEFSVADADGDGADEILVSSSYSRIFKPLTGGEWDILWTATDTNFRFEDVASISDTNREELISLSESEVIIHPDRFHLRFLTGYEYDPEQGLKRNWRSFISLINVRAGDIDGDGDNELVASIYKTHRIYVLERHHLPVQATLLITTIILAGYAITRRIRYGAS